MIFTKEETMTHEGHHPMGNPIMDMPGMNMPSGDLRNTSEMIMHNSFYWGNSAIILFPNWPGQSIGMFVSAFVFVLILATAAEVLSLSPVVKAIKPGAVQVVIYAFRTGFAYLVMLSVMSFNVGIFAAAVAGHTLGFIITKLHSTQAMDNQPNPKV